MKAMPTKGDASLESRTGTRTLVSPCLGGAGRIGRVWCGPVRTHPLRASNGGHGTPVLRCGRPRGAGSTAGPGSACRRRCVLPECTGVSDGVRSCACGCIRHARAAPPGAPHAWREHVQRPDDTWHGPGVPCRSQGEGVRFVGGGGLGPADGTPQRDRPPPHDRACNCRDNRKRGRGRTSTPFLPGGLVTTGRDPSPLVRLVAYRRRGSSLSRR